MKYYRIGEKFVSLIKSCYEGITSRVMLGEELSGGFTEDWCETNAELAVGKPLG